MRKICLFLLLLFTITSSLIGTINNISSSENNNVVKKNNNDGVVQELDKTIVDTYSPNNNVLGQYAMVSKINSIDQLKKYSSFKIRPESVILYIDENLNLVSENNNPLNISLKEAYDTYIKNKMIPLLYISNDAIADSYLNYYSSNFNILDMAIISQDAEIVKRIRTTNTVIRGIIDYSNKDIRKDDLKNIIKELNYSNAITAIVNSSIEQYAVYYIQARFKTVWVEVNEKSTLEVLENINKGISGLICSDFTYLANVSNIYLNTINKNRNINFKPYFIAHRGIEGYYENSLSGAIKAFEIGATHIEFDLRLTKDKQVIVMHDSTIDRTTNGYGKVSDYTYEELNNFLIDSSSNGGISGEGEYIPLLVDYLDFFKNKDIVLILEIKIVSYELLRQVSELIQKYDFYDKAIIMSFEPDVFKASRKYMPQVAICVAGTTNFFNFADRIEYINKFNSTIMTQFKYAHPKLARQAIARGYQMANWTFTLLEEIQQGLTFSTRIYMQDCTSKLTDFGYKLQSKDNYVKVDSFDNLEIELECITYDETNNRIVTAKPLYIEVDGEVAKAIFYAYFVTEEGFEFCVFSDTIILTTSQAIADENNPIEDVPGVSSGGTLEGDNFGRLQ